MEKFKQIISEQFENSQILSETTVLAELEGFDSLTAFSIIDAISEEYHVQLDEEMLNLTLIELYEKVNI